MRILMIVQQLDETHWLRGFIVEWVRALAAQVDHLDVLTLEQGPATLPANVTVYSMGKEKGYPRWRELVEFYRGVGRTVGKVDAIFSHMTPRYTWLAAPFAMLSRKPQLLWFIHPKISTEIRLALWAAHWIVTATPTSFPLPSPKVQALGHGIDASRFSPDDQIPVDNPPLVLTVGRLSRIKNHHVLLETAALLKNVQFAIAGQTATPQDEIYYAELKRRCEQIGLDNFTFLGNLEGEKLVNRYRRATLITNLTPTGSFDKAALEGMLVGKPLLTGNPNFDDLLREHQALLKVDSENPQDVAAKISYLLTLPPEAIRQIGMDLRTRTANAHSLENLMQQIVGLIKNDL